MSDDAELATLRAVNCATVLESVAGWKLDARESTRRALKYRREGEVLIVNHDGRGWWDALSQAKGDVFGRVQHLDPGLNFGHVRQVLHRLIGVAPSYPALVRKPQGRGHADSLEEAGHGAPGCGRDRPPGPTSPESAVCRPRSSQRRPRRMPSARAIAVVPGSPTATVGRSATSKCAGLDARPR